MQLRYFYCINMSVEALNTFANVADTYLLATAAAKQMTLV